MILGQAMMAFRLLAILLLCQLSVVNSAAATCLRPPLGIMHWWPGDGNCQDILAGKNGTLQGGATFAPGLVGQAFHLDGIDGWICVPNDPTLNFGTHDFTVELWVKFADLSLEQVIIEKYIETDNTATREGWSLTKMSGANLIRFGGAVKSPIIDANLSEALVQDIWYHVALTRLGQLFTLYVNGEEVAVGDVAANFDTSASLKFGHRGNPVDTPGSVDTRNFYLNGSVDEVSFYNRALRAAEIQAIFQASASGKCKDVPPPIPLTYLNLLLD